MSAETFDVESAQTLRVTSTFYLLALAAESLELALRAERADPAQLSDVCRLIGELGERLSEETLGKPGTALQCARASEGPRAA